MRVTALVAFLSLALPSFATAATTNLPLESMQQAVSDLYSYSLKIVGLAVFVMFLVAGLAYMVPFIRSRVGEPIEIIKNAVIGLVLLFSAFLILNTINPDLVGGSSSQQTTQQQSQSVPLKQP